MRFLICACAALFLAGCATEPEKVIVPTLVKAEPLSIPNECRVETHRVPEKVKKVAGDKTPPEATEHALATNTKRLVENRVKTQRCYCQISASASDEEKAKAAIQCAAQPVAAAPAQAPASKPATPAPSVPKPAAAQPAWLPPGLVVPKPTEKSP